jgi:hypothetical protein
MRGCLCIILKFYMLFFKRGGFSKPKGNGISPEGQCH